MLVNIKTVLDFMYSEERNVYVQSFWDSGWTIMLGDPTNGFSDSPQVQHEDLDEAATTFINEFLAIEDDATSMRWFQFIG